MEVYGMRKRGRLVDRVNDDIKEKGPQSLLSPHILLLISIHGRTTLSSSPALSSIFLPVSLTL